MTLEQDIEMKKQILNNLLAIKQVIEMGSPAQKLYFEPLYRQIQKHEIDIRNAIIIEERMINQRQRV